MHVRRWLRFLYLLPAAQTRDKRDLTIEQMKAICAKLVAMADFVLLGLAPWGFRMGFKSAAPADRVLIS